ncbi:MAG: Protein serine/threonine phosphatase PrpC, regulation of stationary phase [Firmicutes bacterium]|nr:Protein serine/threonine phosphatase PrpC, regulation of stationary phase [Bacillota bacterium]MDI6705478.1 Stp1/IreP family PP2C-type Ser/Thr phosphatase [Bacillota bacterium]
MIAGAATDPGKVRSTNQDYYLVENGSKYGLYIVADGMGGHNGGEVASRASVLFVKDFIEQAWDKDEYAADRPGLVKDALAAANRAVFNLAAKDEQLRGMGTTLSMAFIVDRMLYTGHIGDSRIYLLRDSQLIKLTEDHSLVAELIKNGSITPEEGDNHPQKNIITRALGTGIDIESDLSEREMQDGDTILLCTDGLTNMLSCADILDLCLNIGEPQLLCSRLVAEANNRGGKDNITVIAVKVRWNK